MSTDTDRLIQAVKNGDKENLFELLDFYERENKELPHKVEEMWKEYVKRYIESRSDYSVKYIKNLSNGLAVVGLKKIIEGIPMYYDTYVNKQGEPAVLEVFLTARTFSEGFGCVQLANGKRRWNYINRTGEYLCDRDFKDAQSFSNGFAKVKLDNERWVSINTKGEIVDKEG